MSVYLKGDGFNYSSIAFDTITLPNPALSPDIMEDNVDVVESDAGYRVCYEKGTYRRIFPYRWTLLSTTQRHTIWAWWQKMKGRLHWFWLQPYDQAITEIIHQAEVPSDYIIRSLEAWPREILYLEANGFWLVVLEGNYQSEARKIINSGPDYPMSWYVVSPAYSGMIDVGIDLLLGFPVTLDESRIQFIPRHPNFWDVEIVFKEKIIDLV
jgi:hypothetical protein